MKPIHPGIRKDGFALVVTISMMVLLTILVVATLSLSSITLRSADRDIANSVAQANARVALALAIGQLQKAAGPDQRITGPANLGTSGSVANPGWTGAWRSDDKNAEPIWLVSGDNPNPDSELGSRESAILANPASGAEAGSAAATTLRAAWCDVKSVKNSYTRGRYAYWVGDEGAKARVDLASPTTAAGSDRERLTRAQSPQEPDLTMSDASRWSGFEPGGNVKKGNLFSMGSVSLAMASGGGSRDAVPNLYLHDLTTGGFGLPVNVKDGGMKADLSLVFDRSQQSKPFVKKVIGAQATPKTLQTGAKVYEFAVTDSSKFYLSKQISDNVPTGVGPNWGNLWNYGRLWENITANQTPVVGLNPLLETDMRQTKWQPYMEHNKSKPSMENRRDVQHTNSGIAPVVSLIQIGFLLGADGPRQVDAGNGTSETRYQAELHVKPIIGMWNPYNVSLKASAYKIEWAILPYLRFDYQKPSANGTFPNGSGNVTNLYLRDYWKTGGNIPSAGNNDGGYIRMITEQVDFQPGEFRLFSVAANPKIEADNKLVPRLEPKGSFKMDIIRDGKLGNLAVDQIGKPLLIKPGFYGWFGDVYLQDTQWKETLGHLKSKYGKDLDKDAATTWFSLKTTTGGDNHLHRFTNLWNGGADDKGKKPYTPEPIISARDRLTVSGASGKTPHRIESLADGNRGFIGAWRFYLRNPTDVEDSGQGLRGWVDSNPRQLSANLQFDGSKVTSAEKVGWNSLANLIGGAHRTGAKAGDVGDGSGGDRGLVAEGNYIANATPQGVPNPDRWQGFGGLGSTAATGTTHFIAYDAPQSPLVSVGQFQHAQIARYNYEPGFVIGNSYANPRIPLGATVNPSVGDTIKSEIVDISYELNERLWDSVFFSTLGLDYMGAGPSGSFDSVFNVKSLTSGATSLPNPRMVLAPMPGESKIDDILSAAGELAPQAIAARIRIAGGFNVNSTSKTAWKAILSTLGASELPVINPVTPLLEPSWEKPDGVRFNRFNRTILNESYVTGGGLGPAFSQGWREISKDELDTLAGEIVKEVKARGPFRTFADFVNRNPSGSGEQQRKGALQAALDRVVNTTAAIPIEMAKPAVNPPGSEFSQAIAGESQAAGHAGYLLQGDILQSLAPIMQVRSDYFRIRTCGEALDKTGKVIARAYCEAFVQRIPEYTDGKDKPEIETSQLTAKANKTFGRHFQLVSFRWLSPSEI